MSFVLAEISRLVGIVIDSSTAVLPSGPTVFKFGEITGQNALGLELRNAGLDCEVREDGIVYVLSAEEVSRRKRAEDTLDDLENIPRMLEAQPAGWKGLANGTDVEKARSLLQSKTVCFLGDPESLESAFEQVEKALGIAVEVPSKTLSKFEDLLNGKVLTLAGERSAAEHLKYLCDNAGLAYFAADEDRIVITSPENLAYDQSREESRRKNYQVLVSKFSQPLSETGLLSMPELVGALEEATGIPVVLTREIWESDRLYRPPAGSNVRDALDGAASLHTLRWTLWDGKIFVIR